MSEDSSPTTGLDDQEESVRIAVKALGDMKNSASRTSSSSRDPSSSSSPDTNNTPNSPAFVARMTHLPFVNSAIRAYEQGKASSRMVKYGAEMVESSVKTISRPVINRLPVDVNQLDEFACRQLDKLDRYRHPSITEPSRMVISPDPSNTTDRGLDENDWTEGFNNPFITPPPPPPDSRSSTPTQNGDESRSEKSDTDERQVAQRSGWQAMLLEAGGLSAALSEESMRRLKYCLQWLQYATAYIDAHILFLRNFTADLQPIPSDSASSTQCPPISEEHMRRLIDVRRDIVHTIRQVVDIVSKYAGGALPEPAKTRVRGFILTLPQRWASKAGATSSGNVNGSTGGSERDSTVTAAASGTAATRRPGHRRAAHRERGTSSIDGGLRSEASSRAPSPSPSPRISRSHARHSSDGDVSGDGGGENGRVPAGTALMAAQRILVLATESLDMMRNVTSVMKDSLDRAEAWVGRLQTVGIQRSPQQQQVEDGDTPELEFSHRSRQDHRRSGSSTRFDEQDMMTMPSSPLFSGSSSTTWGSSSIPSTPGGGGGGGAYTPIYTGGAPSPIAMGAMSLSSRYNTPRSGILALPDEEEEEEDKESETPRTNDVVVKGGLKMDVDS